MREAILDSLVRNDRPEIGFSSAGLQALGDVVAKLGKAKPDGSGRHRQRLRGPFRHGGIAFERHARACDRACDRSTGASGSLLAFAVRDLVALATRTDCTIELIPQVGDFVSTDDPLARIYPPTANISEATINGMMAFGPERTMEQDLMLAFGDFQGLGGSASRTDEI